MKKKRDEMKKSFLPAVKEIPDLKRKYFQGKEKKNLTTLQSVISANQFDENFSIKPLNEMILELAFTLEVPPKTKKQKTA